MCHYILFYYLFQNWHGTIASYMFTQQTRKFNRKERWKVVIIVEARELAMVLVETRIGYGY